MSIFEKGEVCANVEARNPSVSFGQSGTNKVLIEPGLSERFMLAERGKEGAKYSPDET